MADFYKTSVALPDASGIAFDGCHKIYVLMDDEQLQKMREYEYEFVYSKNEMNQQEMLNTLQKWYDESCGLKFIQSIASVADDEDPNLGFDDLISQFENDEDECEDCGERGCYGACEDYYSDEEDDEEDED